MVPPPDEEIRTGPSTSRDPSPGLSTVDDELAHNLDGDLGEGMLAEGFAGPSKVVKPLTTEELSAFKAAQGKTGVKYLSRIPPGMQPTKVRHLMSAHGEIGRVYLQPEGMLNLS